MNGRRKAQTRVVFFVLACIVLIGMASTIVQWIATPKGRIYTGMTGYSSDYVQYVSYIKEGMYGRFTMLFRSFPFPQPTTPIHFLYIGIGVVGKSLGISAPAAYHLSRVVLGIAYGYLVYRLFVRLLGWSATAIVATLLAFSSTPLGWYRPIGGSWVYEGLNFFDFSVNTPERITDRPHYIFGSILFLAILLLIAQENHHGQRIRRLLIALCSFFIAIVHTVSGILLLLIASARLAVCFLQKRIGNLDKQWIIGYGLLLTGGVLGLGLVYWCVRQYTLVPEIWLDSYVYGQQVTVNNIIKYIISFGPVSWVSAVGFVLLVRRYQIMSELDSIMALWFFIQYGLFLFGYSAIHADRVRFVQTLYYVPTAYGAVLFLNYLGERFGKRLFSVGLGCLFLLSIPTYVQDLDRSIHTFTNYRDFSIFVYPSVAQREAFNYFDRYTPTESIVIAQYEVANLLLLYSHNRVIGNDQGWSKEQGKAMFRERTAFFAATMDEVSARKYLQNNNVSYVYYGYQERFVGNISHYTFLKPVFTNSEATVFQVKSL